MVTPRHIVLHWPWWYRSFRGLAIGPVILIKDKRDRALLAHELAHVRQWYAQPFTFWIRYLIELYRHGYINNRYEIEARAQAREAMR